MDQTSAAIPLTGISFPRAEYERRQQKVLDAMADMRLDALLVTALGHARYLTATMARGATLHHFL